MYGVRVNVIAALRPGTIMAEILRKLRVLGPDRHGYRYLVLPAPVEVLSDNDKQEDHDPEAAGAVSPPKGNGTAGQAGVKPGQEHGNDPFANAVPFSIQQATG